MKLNHGADYMIPLLSTLYLELNQILCHHATTYQEALVQALLHQDMTTVTMATMAKTIHFAHKSQVVLLMHSLFPLPLLLTFSLPAAHAKLSIHLETSSAEPYCSSKPAVQECYIADLYLPKTALSSEPFIQSYSSLHQFKDN